MFSKHFDLIFASDISQNLTHQVLLHFLKCYPSHCYYIFQHFTHYSVIISFNILLVRVSGFPRLGKLVGKIILAKRPKTAWKLQNQHFGVKTVGEMVGDKSMFRVVGGSPRPPPPQLWKPWMLLLSFKFLHIKVSLFQIKLWEQFSQNRIWLWKKN